MPSNCGCCNWGSDANNPNESGSARLARLREENRELSLRLQELRNARKGPYNSNNNQLVKPHEDDDPNVRKIGELRNRLNNLRGENEDLDRRIEQVKLERNKPTDINSKQNAGKNGGSRGVTEPVSSKTASKTNDRSGAQSGKANDDPLKSLQKKNEELTNELSRMKRENEDLKRGIEQMRRQQNDPTSRSANYVNDPGNNSAPKDKYSRDAKAREKEIYDRLNNRLDQNNSENNGNDNAGKGGFLAWFMSWFRSSKNDSAEGSDGKTRAKSASDTSLLELIEYHIESLKRHYPEKENKETEEECAGKKKMTAASHSRREDRYLMNPQVLNLIQSYVNTLKITHRIKG